MQEDKSFQSHDSMGTGMPLLGWALGLPPAWGEGAQAEGPQWHEEGWGSDVTWENPLPWGTLILLQEAALLLLSLCPVARKAPEFSLPTPLHAVPPMPRRESRPRTGMASDFCYVATGRPGLGLGQ